MLSSMRFPLLFKHMLCYAGSVTSPPPWPTEGPRGSRKCTLLNTALKANARNSTQFPAVSHPWIPWLFSWAVMPHAFCTLQTVNVPYLCSKASLSISLQKMTFLLSPGQAFHSFLSLSFFSVLMGHQTWAFCMLGKRSDARFIPTPRTGFSELNSTVSQALPQLHHP